MNTQCIWLIRRISLNLDEKIFGYFSLNINDIIGTYFQREGPNNDKDLYIRKCEADLV